MQLKTIFILLGLFFLSNDIDAQHTLSDIVRDTIVRVDKGLVRPFLLDGKPIPTEVMTWFMQDNPDAHRLIKSTRVAETFSATMFTIGFTWIGIDILTHEINDLNWFFAKAGAFTVGLGLMSKWFANRQKTKAVRYYNDGVINAYRKKDMGLRFESKANRVGLVWRF